MVELEFVNKNTGQITAFFFAQQGIGSNRFDSLIQNHFVPGVHFFGNARKRRRCNDAASHGVSQRCTVEPTRP